MARLTKAQRKLFDELAEYPGEWACCENKHERRTANALLSRGLVDIQRRARRQMVRLPTYRSRPPSPQGAER